MNYGDLIAEAFRITWRNRFLWFFGFFVSGALGNFFNVPSNTANIGNQQGNAPFAPSSELVRWISENLVLFLGVVISLFLVLFVVMLFFVMLSHGALADSVAALHRGEQRRFGLAWRAGLANFWRVLGLKVLFFLVGAGIVLVLITLMALLIASTFAITDSTGPRVVVVILSVLLLVVSLILFLLPLSIVNQFALRELVLGDRRITGSIRGSFDLFGRNLGRSLLVWLIVVVLSFGIGIAVLIVLGILAIILLGPAVALFVADYGAVAIVVGVVGGLLFVVPLVVISGAVGTFYHAYWTLAYLRLTAPTGEASPQPGQGA